MPKREKVIEIALKEKGYSTLYIPFPTKARLDGLKIIPEEPIYKVIERLIDFHQVNNGSK